MKYINHGIVAPKSQPLIDHAVGFAAEAHSGQTRKYTHDPYIVHPIAVARKVASVTPDVNVICAAVLHDVIEDTWVTFDDLLAAGFGWPIAQLVLEVTDISKPSDGNRKTRKELDRAHVATASPDGKTIKLADLIDNSCSIIVHDPGFARVYMGEKHRLLGSLIEGDNQLYDEAMSILAEYMLWGNL